MEDQVKEQSAITPAAAIPAGDKDKTDSYGKFSSADELFKAYNALESEFTRRSQRLKELEGKFEAEKAEEQWDRKLKDLKEKYPVAGTLGREIGDYLRANSSLIAEENCLEKALLNVLASRSYNEINSKPEKLLSEPVAVEETSAEAGTELPVSDTQFDSTPAFPKIPVVRALSPAAASAKPKSLTEASRLAAAHLKKLKGE